MDNTDIAARMKKYESVSKTKLMNRTPVIARIDGRAFHTFTKGFEKPFDSLLMKWMQKTTLELCKNIEGCVLGYTQSDEISLLLTDYKKLNSSAFFDYEVQKCCSVIASMATAYFNAESIYDYEKSIYDYFAGGLHFMHDRTGTATFDCRVFNLPFEEVTNYFYWRQLDATKNSIQSVAHVYFSQKELNGLNCNQIQEKLFTERGVNWSTEYPTGCKRGFCAKRIKSPENPRGEWSIDTEIPIFKGDGREYIESVLNCQEE